jgi:hypothetical protein
MMEQLVSDFTKVMREAGYIYPFEDEEWTEIMKNRKERG